MSVVPGIQPIKGHIMAEDHEERKQFIYGSPSIENLLESVSNPRTDTDFAKIKNTTEDNNENAAERGTRINDVQCNEKRESSVQNTEPMDWTPTKSDTSLPSPRSRSRSGSESSATASRTVAVNLFPLADSIVFSPKHLMFTPDQEIKVGRVSGSRNQKEAKAENGVFICDVMSREHAMLKEANGKILIKDTKSTHGTFVNSVRLGDGSKDSEWKELKHGDVITFGHSVRRNQSLYKHLSAYVFYPKEKKEIPPIPIVSSSTQNNEFSNESPKIATNKSEEQVPAVTSACIANDPSTESPTEGFVSPVPVQSKVEKPAEVQKEHKSNKIGESRATSSVVSSVVSGQKNPAPSIRETRQTSEVETTASVVATAVPGSSIKQKTQIGAMKQERRAVTDRNVSKFDVPVVKDEVVPTDDFRKFTDDHKLVTPAITPDPSPLEETNPVTIPKNTIVPFKEKPLAQTSPETKHSKTLHKDGDINESKVDNENVVNNGEGPSHVNETTNPTSSITSRKRKYEEFEYQQGLKQVKELKEQIAVLERYANKRRRSELIASTVVGMIAGVVSIGVGAYMLGS